MEKPLFRPVADRINLLEIPFAGIWTGVYLVRHDRNILIDSGLNAEGVDGILVPALNALGLNVTNLDLLLCTHTHGDHIGGHARLRQLGVRTIGVYEKGCDKLRNPLKYSKLIRAEFPGESAPAPAVLDGVEPDRIFHDGENIDADLRLIVTPGHDSDCVSFFESSTGTLLTGDSVQGNGTITQGCALYMNLPDYRASLGKLKSLPVKRVVTGHPFLPWERSEIENGKALTDCLELLEKYDTFLNSETDRDPASLAVKLIRHLNGRVPGKLFLAMYTVREHLRNRNGN